MHVTYTFIELQLNEKPKHIYKIVGIEDHGL
jgi:hypothetical protein